MPKSLGDFQRRSNRDRDRGWGGRDDEQRGTGFTPQTSHGLNVETLPAFVFPMLVGNQLPVAPGGRTKGVGAGRGIVDGMLLRLELQGVVVRMAMMEL